MAPLLIGMPQISKKLMGHDDEADLLQETLDEEGATDKKLTSLSQSMNKAAFKEAPGM